MKNNNFNLNIQIIELNKLNYENSQLKEKIKKIFQNNTKNTIKQLQESKGKKNDSKNIIKKSVTQNIYNKNSNIKIIPKKNMNNNQLKSNNRVDNKNLNKNKKKNNSKADLSTKENLEYIPQKRKNGN